jgi:hypothetical protein
MENEKIPTKLLFGSIAVYKPEDVDSIIDTMNFEQSFFLHYASNTIWT